MAMQTVRMIAVILLAPVLTKFVAERVRVPPSPPATWRCSAPTSSIPSSIR